MATEDVANLLNESSKLKDHKIPLDHFDFRYIESCQDIKELEKIYRVLK